MLNILVDNIQNTDLLGDHYVTCIVSDVLTMD